MELDHEGRTALRLVWLTGGLVAVNEPRDSNVQIRSSAAGQVFLAFQTKSYASLFRQLQLLGLRIVGTAFITNAMQLEGLRAVEFRAAGDTSGWPPYAARQQWRQIVHASVRLGEMRLMDLASRIAAGLQYSEMRLYDLAGSYGVQLHSCLHGGEVKPYQAFKDTNSPAVYKNIHAFFWEMAVLRDVLAEFIAVFCLGRNDATTLSGLLRSLNKKPTTDPFAVEIINISDCSSAQGWLARFGSYRDCFTHSAPLGLVGGFSYVVQDMLILTNASSVPQVYYPLPQDPDDLMRKRSQRPPSGSVNELASAAETKRDRAKEPDALEYLHGCLCQITELAARLVSRSPVPPRPIVLTEEDFIEGITVRQES